MVREKELENYKSSMCLLNTRIALRTKRKKEEKKTTRNKQVIGDGSPVSRRRHLCGRLKPGDVKKGTEVKAFLKQSQSFCKNKTS